MEQINAWGIHPAALMGLPHFERWVRDHFQGDHESAVWVVNEAIDVIQQLIEGNTPPIMGMFIGMQIIALAGASCDIDTKKLTEFMKENGVPMFDTARYLVQRRENEMSRLAGAGEHLQVVR